MKKLLSLILILTLALSLSVCAFAASSQDVTLYYREIKIVLDGEAINPTDANGKAVEPFIIDGTTYLPLRAVAGALGLGVDWDGETYTVSLTSGGEKAENSGTPAATKGSKAATIYYNDITITLDGEVLTPTDANGKAVEPFIIDGTTYLPLRAIAGALGLSVGWDEASSTVSLTSSGGYYLPVKATTETKYTGEESGTIIVAEFTYDKKGNMLTQTYSSQDEGVSDSMTTSYTYDDMGNCTSEVYTDTDGYTYRTDYTYDGQGNLTKQVYTDLDYTETYTYTYDKDGNCTKEVYTYVLGDYSTGYTQTYTYDKNGNLLTRLYTDTDGYTDSSTYTYNENGDVLTDVYTDGIYTETYEYSYNDQGLLVSSLYSNDQDDYTEVSTYTYDDQGRPLTLACTEGELTYTSTYTYDQWGNVASVTYADSEGYEYSFTDVYNENGDLLSSTYSDTDGYDYSYTYSYDGQGRLVSYTSNSMGFNTSGTITYDANGEVSRLVTVNSIYTVTIDYEYAFFAE